MNSTAGAERSTLEFSAGEEANLALSHRDGGGGKDAVIDDVRVSKQSHVKHLIRGSIPSGPETLT